MKNSIYLILLLFVGITNAQNIVFDGTTFKAKLLSSSTSNNIAKDSNGIAIQIDANSDGEISVAEASVVWELYVQNSVIVNATGIENFINLRQLDISQNSLTSLNLTALTHLHDVDCSQNSLTTIDASTMTSLVTLNASNNLLQTIYAKNGIATDAITFNGGSNSGLSYICIDEDQVTTIMGQLGGIPNCVVNSYCTPTPGGNFNTISGTIVFDTNNNGVDASDAKFPFVKVQCQIGAVHLQTTSDVNGQYTFYTQQTSGSYTVTPSIENSSVFAIPISANGTLGVDGIYDFPIPAIIVPAPDLEVVVSPASSAVAGMNAVYEVTYRNKGSKPVNGNVLLNYDSSNTTIVSCTDASASLATVGQVSLSFANLSPFETRSFYVTLGINSSKSAGSSLTFNATITDNLGATETTTAADNAFTYKQTIGTTNHNTIECLEGVSVDSAEIGKYLHYGINFENSGTAVANNVVVKIVFDTTKYDMNSLQILNSSHPLNLKVAGGNAIFNLSNANIGGPGGDGGILLKIKSDNGLTSGSTVTSGAEIFFDYGLNFNTTTATSSTATTNMASTTFQSLSVAQNHIDASIVVYPNPTNSTLTIDSNNNIKTVQLYDIYGRLLQTNLTDTDKVSIDVTQRTVGTYFLKITSDKGQKVEKIVKD
jgi:hypothetical protein